MHTTRVLYEITVEDVIGLSDETEISFQRNEFGFYSSQNR
jgi:hypothetical protein